MRILDTLLVIVLFAETVMLALFTCFALAP